LSDRPRHGPHLVRADASTHKIPYEYCGV
jgi:hypothetical protein